MKQILVSGIQPSGRLHIGNYLGALKNFVNLQNSKKYKCYFFIADLHSLTEHFHPGEKKRQILDLVANYIAAGLDPKKSIIFQQSQIEAHSELAWIFNTLAPMGELERMTQFKDKAGLKKFVPTMHELDQAQKDLDKFHKKYHDILTEKHSIKEHGALQQMLDVRVFSFMENVIKLLMEYDETRSKANVGLYTYPTLMASDILLYDPDVVPVGNDQLQHLELSRSLARKFNSRFGNLFKEPKDLMTITPRIMSLRDPSKKMSKSDPAGCLFLDDSPEEISAKIARATTDSGMEVSYNPTDKPGLSNLIRIVAALRNEDVVAVERKFVGKSYAEFKKAAAELVSSHYADFRIRKKALLAKPATLIKALNEGSMKAAKIADKKMIEVRKKIGLVF